MQIELTRDELVTLAVVLVSPYNVANAIYWDDKPRQQDLGQRLDELGKKILPLLDLKQILES